ncbi:hypothetical protein [Streptomyces sp. NBC_00872]|uniref:hypothetical protein n=1 Tax=Streptomyces sp. NBC_00872 TaxID=2903686 RepID=UPI0038642282|nr:hypothetical protein OG214_27550 [Streptomyces sp. NBC_00872]
MPSAPDDATAERMRRAHRTAASALFVTAEPAETWGWEGKTLSKPAKDRLWLRLAAVPADKVATSSWDGPEMAEKLIPHGVPRPGLRGVHEWNDGIYAYRAELYDRLKGEPVSKGPLPPEVLDLPDSWWASLRRALAVVSSVPTDRVAVRQQRLHWAMPQFIRADVQTQVPEWTTAHADIQWSNLVGPELSIIDWERWGLAPTGYDAATLYVSSLTVPEVAKKVWHCFGSVLDSPAGRFSQLVAASEYIQGIQRGNNLELEAPLRKLIAQLLV